ncbi:MAG: MFS transporter [Terracidiphilus sp.]
MQMGAAAKSPTLHKSDVIAVVRSFALQFNPSFWKFFAAAFFFDFGFGLFFFLFNLYLTDLHFNEKSLGLITGALTLGNVAGTVPVIILVRRFGLQKLILFCFSAAPLTCVLRTFMLWPAAQIGLAFLTGVALCSWPICFSPMVAKLTNEKNRAAGFSVTFATGIGLGTLAGLAGGYLPELLLRARHAGSIVGNIRIVLLLACGVVLLGLIPILSFRLEAADHAGTRRIRIFHPFLFLFLPPFIIWTIVTGSFPPFAAVYLQQHLGIPLRHIGVIFSASQLVQFVAVLSAPFLYRRIGTVAGIACAQVATAVALFCMGNLHALPLSVACYLGYTGLQWMSSPGIYSFLMDHIPEEERTIASAIQNISGALCQAGTVAITGSCIVRLGYPAVLFGNSGIAVLAAILSVLLFGNSLSKKKHVPPLIAISHAGPEI